MKAGARAFADGRYFEAHELWEAEWLTAEGDDRRFLQGLIQMAVALHHRANGNRRGFEKLRARAMPRLGAPLAQLLARIEEDETAIREAVSRWLATAREPPPQENPCP